MANDKISAMTAAVVGDLAATTSGFEVSHDLAGTPTTKRLTLGVLADWLEASQLAALIVTDSVASATAIATPAAFAATRFAGFASTVSGAAIMGFGTTNDVALMNRAGTVCLGVGPNTTAINIPGTLVVTGQTNVTGNIIVTRTAATALFQLISVGGSGRAFSVFSSTAGVLGVYDDTAGADRLTISATGAVAIPGTLTVTGAFGCNGATAQTAVTIGAALAAYVTGGFGLDSNANMSALHADVVAMRAALLANGILVA